MQLKFKRYWVMVVTAVNMQEASLIHQQKITDDLVLKYNSRSLKDQKFGLGWSLQEDLSLLKKKSYQIVWDSSAQQKIRWITRYGKTLVSFRYNGDHLIQIHRPGQIYTYKYDEFSNLTEIQKNHHWQQKIQYQNERDWVTQIQTPDGCLRSYSYQSRLEQGLKHLSSQVYKTCPHRKSQLQTYPLKATSRVANGDK